jgi:hypothetical protein
MTSLRGMQLALLPEVQPYWLENPGRPSPAPARSERGGAIAPPRSDGPRTAGSGPERLYHRSAQSTSPQPQGTGRWVAKREAGEYQAEET